MKSKVLLTMARVLAIAAVLAPNSAIAAPKGDQDVRIHSLNQTQTILATAQSDRRYAPMEDFVVKRGYRPRLDLAFSGEATAKATGSADGEILIVPCEGPGDQQAVMHVGRLGSVEEWGVSLLSKNGNNIVGDDFIVSATGDVVPTHSWWSCFWRCVLTSCGSGAVGCIWAGPAWWHCVLAVCGASAIFCSITCIGQ